MGEVGASWVRPVTSGSVEQWLAAVWVRDLVGRRRLVKARRPGRREPEVALQERLSHRRSLGFRGAEPNMTVQELGEYWMRRRLEEARALSIGERQGDDGAVSMQTLAGYQTALSRIINPRLGGLRLTEARTGVSMRPWPGSTSASHHPRRPHRARPDVRDGGAGDALTANPMREVRPQP